MPRDVGVWTAGVTVAWTIVMTIVISLQEVDIIKILFWCVNLSELLRLGFMYAVCL
jgi:hypothetical protein